MKNRILLLGLLVSLCLLTSCKKEEKKEWNLYYSPSIDELLGTFKGSGTFYEYGTLSNGNLHTTTTNSNDVTVKITKNRTNVSFYLNAPNVFTRTISGDIYSNQPYIVLAQGGSTEVTYSSDNQIKTEIKSVLNLNCEILKNSNTDVLRYEGDFVFCVTTTVYERDNNGVYVYQSSSRETMYKFSFAVDK